MRDGVAAVGPSEDRIFELLDLFLDLLDDRQY